MGGSNLTACDYLACELVDMNRFAGVNLQGLIYFMPHLVFAIIILTGIYYIIKGVMRIVRSEGDSSKIEEGMKIMKSIYIGLCMILGGFVGLAIVLVVFDSGGLGSISL